MTGRYVVTSGVRGYWVGIGASGVMADGVVDRSRVGETIWLGGPVHGGESWHGGALGDGSVVGDTMGGEGG